MKTTLILGSGLLLFVCTAFEARPLGKKAILIEYRNGVKVKYEFAPSLRAQVLDSIDFTFLAGNTVKLRTGELKFINTDDIAKAKVVFASIDEKKEAWALTVPMRHPDRDYNDKHMYKIVFVLSSVGHERTYFREDGKIIAKLPGL